MATIREVEIAAEAETETETELVIGIVTGIVVEVEVEAVVVVMVITQGVECLIDTVIITTTGVMTKTITVTITVTTTVGEATVATHVSIINIRSTTIIQLPGSMMNEVLVYRIIWTQIDKEMQHQQISKCAQSRLMKLCRRMYYLVASQELHQS